MGVLRLLGPDQSTLLFDFTAPTGTGNPNTLITRLVGGVDLGTVAPELRVRMLEAGANLQGIDLPPVEVRLELTASAATDDDLWAGLGQLGRYLLQVSREHPLYLEWSELGTTYYYDVIGALELPQLFRGQATGAIISTRRNTVGGVPIRLLRQPWRRGASVTTSADVVEDDPATGTPDQSRLAAFTITGDLPTPCKVRAQMDTGSTVTYVLMGHRWRGSRPSTYMTDYRDETSWLQCESSSRGWTITLENDTTATTDGALASPGSGNVVAQVAAGGASTGLMRRRIRATRTTLMDSLRGTYVPHLRVKALGAAEWSIKLKWGPTTAEPIPFEEDAVTHDTTLATAFGYVELELGRMDIPLVVPLSGMALEVWAQRLSGSTGLNMDLMWLPPDPLTAIVVPEGVSTTVLGKNLLTPVTNPAGGTAGVINGDALLMDTTTDNAGVGPNGGTPFAPGLWRVLFTVSGTNNLTGRVRNITDSLDTATVTLVPNGFVKTFALDFTAVSGKLYQLQVDDGTGTNVAIQSITWFPLFTIAANESVRTDPGPVRYATDKLDSSGNLAGYLEVEGIVPLMGQPGDNQLVIRADEVPLAGYTERENKLDRDITVTITFDPRYAA